MGNVCTKKKGPSRKLVLAIVGLDNAGKTVTTKGLQGEPLDDVAPTIGFSNANFKFAGHDITLFDLGGGKKIRDIWKSYFAEIYALVYVIDASDVKRMDECKHVLANLLHHPQIKGKPILVLANKQDKDGALDEIDICEQLSLEELVNINKCPCRIEMCSAIQGQGKRMDPPIKKGMFWLLQTIDSMWDKLHERVQKDITEKQEREANERRQKKERVQKIRAEREKKEAEEKRKRGGEGTLSDEEDDALKGDPFKRLDYAELKKKEQQLKNKKKNEQNRKNNDSQTSSEKHSGSDNENYDQKNHRLNRHQLQSEKDSEEDDEDDEVPHQIAIKSTQGRSETFSSARFPHSGSPQHSRHKLKPLHLEQYEDSSDSESKEHRTPRPYDLNPAPSFGPRAIKGVGAGEEESDGLRLTRRLTPIMPSGQLEPLDGISKKKKKKAKKNQTVPVLGDIDNINSSPQSGNSPFGQRGWSTSAGQRNLTKASRSPALETLREPESDSENVNSFSAKWGLDLPDYAPSNRGNLRPNFESDNDIIT